MAQNEAAIFDAQNPASPLSVGAAQTALLLMDYHSILIARGGEPADAAIVKAKSMRDWAIAKGFIVIHCLIDLHQSILPSFKSAARFKQMT
jgi:hypothetical protein